MNFMKVILMSERHRWSVYFLDKFNTWQIEVIEVKQFDRRACMIAFLRFCFLCKPNILSFDWSRNVTSAIGRITFFFSAPESDVITFHPASWWWVRLWLVNLYAILAHVAWPRDQCDSICSVFLRLTNGMLRTYNVLHGILLYLHVASLYTKNKNPGTNLTTFY